STQLRNPFGLIREWYIQQADAFARRAPALFALSLVLSGCFEGDTRKDIPPPAPLTAPGVTPTETPTLVFPTPAPDLGPSTQPIATSTPTPDLKPTQQPEFTPTQEPVTSVDIDTILEALLASDTTKPLAETQTQPQEITWQLLENPQRVPNGFRLGEFGLGGLAGGKPSTKGNIDFDPGQFNDETGITYRLDPGPIEKFLELNPEIISTIFPENKGTIRLVDAIAICIDDTMRLPGSSNDLPQFLSELIKGNPERYFNLERDFYLLQRQGKEQLKGTTLFNKDNTGLLIALKEPDTQEVRMAVLGPAANILVLPPLPQPKEFTVNEAQTDANGGLQELLDMLGQKNPQFDTHGIFWRVSFVKNIDGSPDVEPVVATLKTLRFELVVTLNPKDPEAKTVFFTFVLKSDEDGKMYWEVVFNEYGSETGIYLATVDQ
ncbi:hypothetical protein KA082_01355, partial [Candidatus Woesebacteria bacterium]|nr:hypothetical protein [Candidatus Woesebacteria bacterium]